LTPKNKKPIIGERKEWLETVGHNIKTVREAKDKMQQNHVARASNITPGFLCQIEHGDSWPSLETLYDIAKTLNVPPAFLLSPRRITLDEARMTLQFMAILDRGAGDSKFESVKTLLDALS